MKDTYDRECRECPYGNYYPARLTADPYYSSPAECTCDYDFDCPYIEEECEDEE